MSVWTLCVHKKNLSLLLILDVRRSKQHFRVPSKFAMATGDSFSRIEILTGNPDGGEAPGLHIASGDVQNAFHNVGISDWRRPFFFA